MATAFLKMSRSIRSRSFSRRSREISAAGSGTECGADAGIGRSADPHPALRFHCASCAASRGNAELACDLAQRPTTARRQGYRFLLELIRKMTPCLGPFDTFRSRRSLAKVSAIRGNLIALPITIGAVRYPGIKIHDPRVVLLLEVLLHGGSQVGGWTAKHIHHAVFTTFHLSDSTYRLNQLRYDLRKLKAHGLLRRDGSCYAYRLIPKGGSGRPALPVLSQTALRPACQQPLPPLP